MRRTALAVLLAICLLVAGCQPAPGGTTTPFGTPSADTANPDGFY